MISLFVKTSSRTLLMYYAYVVMPLAGFIYFYEILNNE